MSEKIPAHWLRLAGELLADSQGLDQDEHLPCPEDWHPDDYLAFKADAHGWLNEGLEEDKYDANSPLLNWHAMTFLGRLLQEVETEPDDILRTQVLVVNPC